MKTKITDYHLNEFVKFVGVGGIASIFNFFFRYFFNKYIEYEVSIIFAYIVGMMIAFGLNKLVVFRATNKSIYKQIGGFILVNLLGMLQTLIISVLFKNYIFVALNFNFFPAGMAHFIGLGSTAFTSYLGHKYISFGVEKDRA